MKTACRRCWVALCVLILPAFLMSCVAPREPAYDAAITQELTELVRETAMVFSMLALPLEGDFASRSARYRRLEARASTLSLMASVRLGGAQAGRRAASRFDRLVRRLSPDQEEKLGDYANATVGYMDDFQRNLAQLRELDRAATERLNPAAVRYQQSLQRHRREIADYQEDLDLWLAGQGGRPNIPTAPPEPPRPQLNPTQVALRRAQLEDILRDALIYERNILKRNR